MNSEIAIPNVGTATDLMIPEIAISLKRRLSLNKAKNALSIIVAVPIARTLMTIPESSSTNPKKLMEYNNAIDEDKTVRPLVTIAENACEHSFLECSLLEEMKARSIDSIEKETMIVAKDCIC